MRLTSFLFTPALLAIALSAQQLPQRGPDAGGTRNFVPGIDILSLPGIPFAGRDLITWTRPVAGGGTVTTIVEANAARDSEGRLYRERHHFAPAGTDPASTIYESSVVDPNLHTRTVCSFTSHRCEITDLAPHPVRLVPPAGPFDHGRRYLSRESLGTREIESLSVTGTRETTSIAPATLGNDRPLTLVSEFWYSADLKNNLEVTRNDPREGTVVIHLSILSRAEPDRGIFAIPAGFTVSDHRQTAVK